MEDKSLPLFDADAAEEYISCLLREARQIRSRIYDSDNDGRHPSEAICSTEYYKWLGREFALKQVLEYFSQYDLGTPNA